jgi:hypothetical protein
MTTQYHQMEILVLLQILKGLNHTFLVAVDPVGQVKATMEI